jgi:hypothetical protein
MLELTEFQRSINDLKKGDPATVMILTQLCALEDAGNPPTAADLALCFDCFDDASIRQVNRKLKGLMKDGLVGKDGDRYRYTPKRPLTPAEERKFRELNGRIKKLQPVLERMRQHDA